MIIATKNNVNFILVSYFYLILYHIFLKPPTTALTLYPTLFISLANLKLKLPLLQYKIHILSFLSNSSISFNDAFGKLIAHHNLFVPLNPQQYNLLQLPFFLPLQEISYQIFSSFLHTILTIYTTYFTYFFKLYLLLIIKIFYLLLHMLLIKILFLLTIKIINIKVLKS